MIKLSRTITVSSFDVSATVAIGRNKPEYLAIAQLAADLNRPITPDDISMELIGPLPEVLCKRVIERCIALGLLESIDNGAGKLSEAGQLALQYDQVLVPEEGVWRFFVVDDPLVPAVLLHAERLETKPVKEERNAAKNGGQSNSSSQKMPPLLKGCKGNLPCMSVQSGHLTQIIELSNQGTTNKPVKLELELVWNEQNEQPMISLRGSSLDDSQKSIDANVELPNFISEYDYASLWAELVNRAEKIEFDELLQWAKQVGKMVAPIPFHLLNEVEKRTFLRTIQVPQVKFKDLGLFNSTTLSDITLVPSSDNDAQEWLNWLEWDGINDYMTPSMLEQKSRDLLSKFPYHQPAVQHPQKLLELAFAAKGDERAKFLIAPSDLGLWRQS